MLIVMLFMSAHLREMDLGFVCDFAKTGQVHSLQVILERLTIGLVQLREYSRREGRAVALEQTL